MTAISLLKLSLSDRRYVSKQTFLLYYRLIHIACQREFVGLLCHLMRPIVCHTSQQIVITEEERNSTFVQIIELVTLVTDIFIN